jgi:hypothetical protein
MRPAITIVSLAFALATALPACATDAELGRTRQAVIAESACAGLEVCTDDSACGVAHEAAPPAPLPALASAPQSATAAEPPKSQPLECKSCHSSWTPNCMTCHMDFDFSQTVGEIWPTAPSPAPSPSTPSIVP